MKNVIIILLLFAIIYPANGQEAERKLAFDNYHKYYSAAQEIKDNDKQAAIDKYRKALSKKAYRGHSLNTKLTWKECIGQLNDDGSFKDLHDKEQAIIQQNGLASGAMQKQLEIGLFLEEAFNRIWSIGEAYRSGKLTEEEALSPLYIRAILHYGNMEISRNNKAHRFHSSCFAIPTATVNTYFAFLQQMDAVESGQNKDEKLIQACDMLKALSLQSWTQPLRNDETDNNVVSTDRFRNHVWWVGGNALAYRSLLQCAVMYKSIPMIDVLAEVAQKGIGMVSQSTYDQAFWNEGFTVDGAGWGHGKQCLIWGYPIDGTSNALNMLVQLKGSPWAKKLTADNKNALLNFLRGGNWYYYKGYRLPCLDRFSAAYYEGKEQPIPYSGLLKNVIDNWGTSFSDSEIAELKKLYAEVGQKRIEMDGTPEGIYSGSRWFFNNDDLIKKNKDYHITINMASLRCDGLESATNVADEYNFFTADGLTLFQKNGDEYFKIIGAWDITASPGVTAREGMERITPVTNWRGYCSKYNFAGAATHGGENAVAGYIFEKMNGSDKEGVNDKGSSGDKNKSIYGVQAYKSYFIIGDYMIALGAGVSNLTPDISGNIRTTIDQTALTSGIVSIDSKGKSSSVTAGVHPFVNKGKAVWVSQKGGFSYTVLPAYTRNAFYTYETKSNEWVKRNKSNEKKKDLPATADILRLWVDHGTSPDNDTYGYVVYCGSQTPKQLPFEVLQNDKNIQAVQSTDKTVTEAVFYTAHSPLKAKGLSLSVSAPATVLIEEQGRDIKVSVNDPTMNAELKKITISYNGRLIDVDMPQNEYCGKPVSVVIKK